MATRIGVDIGGTFTDLIFHDELTGEIRAAKVPTSSERPDEGVIRAIEQSLPTDAVRRTRFFLHGTTVGLNALLQRKGAVVGLLATDGFRDILEIRRGSRDDMYNLFWRQPPPLVPRRLRLPSAAESSPTAACATIRSSAPISKWRRVFLMPKT